jgi:DNA (cytosine-5)-methyltransferase 1
MEAATAAWHGLGWTPAFFSEIDKTPARFLAAKFPHVPNYGDMTKFEEWPDHAIDVLVGGTPCQGFSVAGLRCGLDDDRSQLSLVYAQIARRYRPETLVWENVPGVLSSDEGRDFGTFLGLLAGRRITVPKGGWQTSGIIPGYERAYGLAWRVLDAQFTRVGSHPGAVPQRRRRVFVVGCSGDWRRAAAILFERESLRWNPAPRRQAGQGTAAGIEIGPSGGCFTDVNPTLDARAKDGPVRNQIAGAVYGPAISPSLKARDAKGPSSDGDGDGAPLIAHSLSANGFDASEDGTGRGTPIIPVAFSSKDHGADAGEIAPTLRGMGHSGSHANGGGQVAIAIQGAATRETVTSGPDGIGVRADGASYTLEARSEVQAVAFAQNQRDEIRLMDIAGALAAEPGMKQQTYIQQEWAVRRLTPLECLRLQGFPDSWFDDVRLNKPLADGPMYKMIGNSMAVNIMRWIGERIEFVGNTQERMVA